MTSGCTSTIKVFYGTFEGSTKFLDSVIQCEEDFASCLIDHEAKHGQQHLLGKQGNGRKIHKREHSREKRLILKRDFSLEFILPLSRT